MTDPTRGEVPGSIALPIKTFLAEEELLEIWETRGMKYRVDELHKFCLERGLLPHNRADSFRKKVFGILRTFLCEGETRRDPRYVPPLKKLKRV